MFGIGMEIWIISGLGVLALLLLMSMLASLYIARRVRTKRLLSRASVEPAWSKVMALWSGPWCRSAVIYLLSSCPSM